MSTKEHYLTVKVTGDNFEYNAFVNDKFGFDLKTDNGNVYRMGWFEIVDKEGGGSLNWDGVDWFIDLTPEKKLELKRDLHNRGLYFPGWFKELKSLIKKSKKLGVFPTK